MSREDSRRETQLAQSHEGEGAVRSGVLESRERITGQSLNARLEGEGSVPMGRARVLTVP